MSSQPDPTIGELLLALRRKLAYHPQAAGFRDGLSATQFEALWLIALSGSATMESIARQLAIKPPSATALVRTLERKGLVLRRGDPGDRRVVNIALTPSARRRILSLKKEKEAAFDSLLAQLSAADRKELARLLILLTQA